MSKHKALTGAIAALASVATLGALAAPAHARDDFDEAVVLRRDEFAEVLRPGFKFHDVQLLLVYPEKYVF